MIRSRVFVTITAAGFCLLGLASAQEGQADVAVRREANLSPAEKVERAQEIVSKATRLSERVASLLSAARREADMIRITCLTDKLTQINANLRNAETRLGTLTGAVEPALQDHEFTVIGVLGQKFTTLAQEANQCVGQTAYETGTSTNDTQVDESQAGGAEDGAAVPQPTLPVVVVPPPRSPNV